MSISEYAKNLYTIDKYDFYDKKGKPGWYDFSSECGYFEIDGILAWQELPEVYAEDMKGESDGYKRNQKTI